METSLDEAGCRPQEGPGAISVTVPAQVPRGSSMHSRSCSEHGERGGFLVHLQAIRAVAETFLSPTASALDHSQALNWIVLQQNRCSDSAVGCCRLRRRFSLVISAVTRDQASVCCLFWCCKPL